VIQLYPHQQKALDETIEAIDNGNKMIISYLVPSFGKTFYSLFLAMHYNTKKVIIAMNMSPLIDQFVSEAKSLNLPITVLKSNHEINYDPNARIVIGMEQTIAARLDNELKDMSVDIYIRDEIHNGFHGDRLAKIKAHLDPDVVVGMSGTPWNQYGYGFPNVDKTVYGPTIKWMTDQGYLSKLTYLIPGWTLRKKLGNKFSGEYSQDDLEEHYTDTFQNRVIDNFMNNNFFEGMNTKSVWFCSSVKMAEEYAAKLQSLGYPAFTYHGKMKQRDRDIIMDAYRSNTPMKVDKDINLFNYSEPVEEVIPLALVSVQTLTTGFSVKDIEVGVYTSSTSVLSKHHQSLARLIRKPDHQIVKYFMDFGRNVERLGTVEDHYDPPPYDADFSELKEKIEALRMEHLGVICDNDDEIYAIDRNVYESELNNIISDTRKFSEMSTDDLKKQFEVTKDISTAIAIGLTFMKLVHGQQMKNKWGKDDIGYYAISFDKERNVEVEKPVVGWYNPKSLQWISEPAEKLFARFSHDKRLLKKWFKSYKTRIRNIVNDRKNIYQIRFYAEKLLDDEIENIGTDNYFYIHHVSECGMIYKYELPESAYDGELEKVTPEQYREYVLNNKYDTSLTVEDNLKQLIDASSDDDDYDNPFADDYEVEYVDVMQLDNLDDLDDSQIPF